MEVFKFCVGVFKIVDKNTFEIWIKSENLSHQAIDISLGYQRKISHKQNLQ